MSTLRKVLVVDDDPVISKSFNRVLAGKGYVVVSAENGEEALKKIASEQYDAVFTDIRMPGMDGIEVAEQLRAKQPWMPVVIITGYGSAENEARAEAAGVKEFLHKPLSPQMIEQSVKAAVENAQPAPAEPQAVADNAGEATQGQECRHDPQGHRHVPSLPLHRTCLHRPVPVNRAGDARMDGRAGVAPASDFEVNAAVESLLTV